MNMTPHVAPAALSRRSRVLAALMALALVLLLGAIAKTGPAEAKTGVIQFEAEVSDTQAGGHPDVYVHGTWHTHVTPPNAPCNCDDVRIVTTNMPTGFIGNQHAVTACSYAQFTLNKCSADAQLGAVMDPGPLQQGYVPLYNLEAPADQAGRVGFIVPLVSAPQLLNFVARTESDYGLTVESSQIFHILPALGIDMWLWGVPADPKHDSARFRTPVTGTGACSGEPNPEYGGLPYPNPCPNITEASATIPPVPLLQNPTTCGVPLSAGMEIEYYTKDIATAEYPWPATDGCDQLSFNPSLTTKTTTSQADTASGLDVDLKVPQAMSADTPSPSEIRASTTTLPAGFSINPNAADGKTSCTDLEGSFGTREAARCPEHAKVGTLEIDSSALPGPIFGAIYIGEPLPGNRYRTFLTADGFGTHVKLVGTVSPDPQTGQIQVSFEELPQTPFSRFNMHFFGSERGLMATPTQCGTYAVESDFVPWDNALPTQHLTSYFTVDSGPGGRPCPGKPRPFEPRLEAGTWNSTAGLKSPLTIRITRDDGDQNLQRVDVTTPPGFSAYLTGIPYCPEATLSAIAAAGYTGLAELASPGCASASQVGAAVTGAGAGTHPLYTAGKVYLAGPYKGAPLSLAVVVPAVSGPYDLGNVIVRVALNVDPVTAQVTAFSDPLPQILEGIPLRLRSILINLDRPDFTLNPTNCNPLEIGAVIAGSEGAIAQPKARFQASNCRNLHYGPRLTLKLSGGLKRRGHPAVQAVLTAGAGDANSRRISVSLPPGEQLDNGHIQTICTRVQFAADNCPAGSQIGEAEAQTPLLDRPLEGKVYLRSSSNDLPDLVVDLRGQVDIELAGRIDTTKDGALRTTFSQVPDAPVSRVELNLAGGSKGLLINSESLCDEPKRAKVRMTAQNGASLTRRPKLLTNCGAAARHKRHHDRRAGR